MRVSYQQSIQSIERATGTRPVGFDAFWLLEQGFALRVDGRPGECFRVGDEAGQKAPKYHVQSSSPELLIPNDDRLHRLRSYVVVGGEFEGEPINIAQREGFSDALLIKSALVAATHRLPLCGLALLSPSLLLSRADSCSRICTHNVLTSLPIYRRVPTGRSRYSTKTCEDSSLTGAERTKYFESRPTSW